MASSLRARVAADCAPSTHDGVPGAHLPQEQLLLSNALDAPLKCGSGRMPKVQDMNVPVPLPKSSASSSVGIGHDQETNGHCREAGHGRNAQEQLRMARPRPQPPYSAATLAPTPIGDRSTIKASV